MEEIGEKDLRRRFAVKKKKQSIELINRWEQMWHLYLGESSMISHLHDEWSKAAEYRAKRQAEENVKSQNGRGNLLRKEYGRGEAKELTFWCGGGVLGNN